MKWIRLWPDYIINGTTFDELDAEVRGVWFSFLALAGYSPFPGEICIAKGLPYTREQMAAIIKIDIVILNRAIDRMSCEEVHKIKVNETGTISILNWNKYQTEYERQKPFRGPATTERNKIHTANSRARKFGNTITFTIDHWKAILKEWEYTCAYCGIMFGESNGPTIDHMTPLILGGQHIVENIVPSCGKCNSSKRNKTIEEFAPDKASIIRKRQCKLQGKLQGISESKLQRKSISISTSISSSTIIPKEEEIKNNAVLILNHLNHKAGRKFSDTKQIVKMLKAGKQVDQFLQIIDTKLFDPFFTENPQYFNPTTLFRESHWDTYINQKREDFKQKEKKPTNRDPGGSTRLPGETLEQQYEREDKMFGIEDATNYGRNKK
jgi:uncharacterized phage protein (TIGR02220 family)